MALYFENVTFSVSGVPKSKKAEDQLHFCVNLAFETQEDLEAYAVAHGRVVTQQLIRNDIEINRGVKERPSGYKDYSLKPVARGILPEGTKFTANATINHKGVVQPTLDEQVNENVAKLKGLLAAKLAKDPTADVSQITEILKLLEG